MTEQEVKQMKQVAALVKALSDLLSFDAKNPEPRGWTREHWTGIHRRAYQALGDRVPAYCAEIPTRTYCGVCGELDRTVTEHDDDEF